jgi:hypothetical protein
VVALVDIKKAGKSIPYKPGMVVPVPGPVEKTDFPMELTFNTGESYWYVIPGVKNYFDPRPNPTMLAVEGSYIADSKRQRIKQQVPIK